MIILPSLTGFIHVTSWRISGVFVYGCYFVEIKQCSVSASDAVMGQHTWDNGTSSWYSITTLCSNKHFMAQEHTYNYKSTLQH